MENINISSILEKAISGERISLEEGVCLIESDDLILLGKAADDIRKRFHEENIITFVIDRNINYTNICINQCDFCAFWRRKEDKDAYNLKFDEILSKVDEAVNLGATQILMQGGLNPDLKLDYFFYLLELIKKNYKVHLHSLSPPEITYLSKSSGLSISHILKELKRAGLDSLPGGGAEILVDRVRKIISPRKINSQKWLEVMEIAHQIGMKTTATMMFGSVETLEERIIHLDKIRSLQDQKGGFRAFIPWSFQPGRTKLGGREASSIDYLKTLAVGRIYLDNIENIQGSWVTQGDKIGQLSLFFGANDLGSTMIEENVVRSTGVAHCLSQEEMVRLIKDIGKIPAQRDTEYHIIKYFE